MNDDVLEVDVMRKFNSIQELEDHVERLKDALPNFHITNIEVSITFKEKP